MEVCKIYGHLLETRSRNRKCQHGAKRVAAGGKAATAGAGLRSAREGKMQLPWEGGGAEAESGFEPEFGTTTSFGHLGKFNFLYFS
jgi:hypothetical protein